MYTRFLPKQNTINRLADLEKISSIIDENKIYYCVIGGFAVDGYHGQLSRNHADVDVVCYDYNFSAIEKILNIRFESKALKDEKEPYKYYNDDKTLSFNVLKKINNKISIAFWYLGHLKYPQDFFNRTRVTLGKVSFYAINKNSLVYLKERQRDIEVNYLEKPKHKEKYDACCRDLKILKNNYLKTKKQPL